MNNDDELLERMNAGIHADISFVKAIIAVGIAASSISFFLLVWTLHY